MCMVRSLVIRLPDVSVAMCHLQAGQGAAAPQEDIREPVGGLHQKATAGPGGLSTDSAILRGSQDTQLPGSFPRL